MQTINLNQAGLDRHAIDLDSAHEAVEQTGDVLEVAGLWWQMYSMTGAKSNEKEVLCNLTSDELSIHKHIDCDGAIFHWDRR